MAEFYSIFCRPFVPSVLLILGVGGIGDRAGWGGTGWGGWCGVGGVGLGGVGWGGVGGGKTPVWDTPCVAMMPIQWPMTYRWPHSRWEETQVPTAHNWHPPWVPLYQP